MTDFLTALALVFVIEGLVLAIFPGAPLAAYRMMSAMPPERLRVIGLCAAALGIAGVWLMRG